MEKCFYVLCVVVGIVMLCVDEGKATTSSLSESNAQPFWVSVFFSVLSNMMLPLRNILSIAATKEKVEPNVLDATVGYSVARAASQYQAICAHGLLYTASALLIVHVLRPWQRDLATMPPAEAWIACGITHMVYNVCSMIFLHLTGSAMTHTMTNALKRIFTIAASLIETYATHHGPTTTRTWMFLTGSCCALFGVLSFYTQQYRESLSPLPR